MALTDRARKMAGLALSGKIDRQTHKLNDDAKLELTYLTRAEELERGEADDRRLAKDIRAFVAGMAVPLTRRQPMAAELGRVRVEHQSSAPTIAADHQATPPGQNQPVHERHRSQPRR